MSYAQFKELTFKRYSKERGLSSANVTCFAQTPDGFLWVGTHDGLNQFDGYSFKVYRNDPEDSLSISDNNITTLFVDQKGNLWIGTENGGLSRYNSQDDTFINYRHKLYDARTISSDYVTSITEDADHQLWVGTVMGLNRFDDQTQHFSRYFHEIAVQVNRQTIDSLKRLQLPETVIHVLARLENKEFLNERSFVRALRRSLSGEEIDQYMLSILRYARLRTKSDYIKALQADDKGNLWIGYEHDGLAYFNPGTKKLKSYQHIPGQAGSLSSNEILSLCLDKHDLWIGTRNGLLSRLDIAADTFSTYVLPEKGHNMEAMLVDSKGTLWIGNDYGLYRYDKSRKEFYIYQHQETNEFSLSTTAVKAIFEDSQQNLWVGCDQGGVNITLTDNPFQHFKHNPESPNSLSKNSISSLLEDRHGNIWIGYYAMGIDVWHKERQELTHYAHQASDAYSLGKGTVFDIHEDRDGEIWVGTYEGGLQLFDRENKRFITYKHDPADMESISGNDIRSIVEDEQGSLWLAVHGKGINVFNKHTKKVRRYQAQYLDWQNSLANDWVYTLYIDKKGNIWAGSVFGVSVLKKGAKDFVTYSKENRKLSHNSVRAILEDHQGNMWIGTENGLNLLDKQTNKFRSFSEKDGLPNSTIHGLLQDKHGYLWISTNNGLVRFDPGANSFIQYTVSDGLQADEFFPGTCHQGKSGAMYFGGPNGLNMFFPEKIHPDTGSVPVRLTGLQLFNKPVDIKDSILGRPLDQKTSICLRHDQNMISFEYVGLNFKNPEKVQFAYMLEGFDADWNYVGTKREATYTNLDAGDYVLKVKAANSDGVWNENSRELALKILPPFWMTPVAFVLYFFLVLCLLYLFRRSALAKERLKNKLKLQKLEAQKTHELDMLKLKFFTNISHEFRSPLTLILGPIERLMLEHENIDAVQRMDYYKLVNRNAQRMLRLVNQLLDMSAIDAGFMKLSVVRYDVVDFCRNISDAFIYRASDLEIQYTFNSNVEKAEVYVDHDKLEKILYNLISNALKSTPAGGEVSVRLSLKEHTDPELPLSLLEKGAAGNVFLKLEVEDNGSGVPPAQQLKIFERFYQIDNKLLKKSGTGIGLALVKQLVERHYGTIMLESEEGKGSKFMVWLPVSKERYGAEEIGEGRPKIGEKVLDIRSVYQCLDSDAPQVEAENNEKQLMGHPAVLIVEDCEEVRRYISRSLRKEYVIYEAGDGKSGLEKVLDKNPDLVISDVMMPGMDGLEFCRKLKNDPQTSHIPVVLLTARSTEKYELEGLNTGADDYISKPFNMLLFKARIRNIIDSRQKIKEKLYSDLSFEPKNIATNCLDQAFVNKLLAVIESHLSDESFNPDALAVSMHLSRSQLYKKIKGLTGLSVSILIRNIRLRKACELLKTHSMSISEVAYQVGFSDPGYFAKCFKEMYSQSPSEYLHKQA